MWYADNELNILFETNKMKEILYGLVCLILAFFMFKIHINWRKNKKIEYKSDELDISDYRHFIIHWRLIVAFVIYSVMLLFKGSIKLDKIKKYNILDMLFEINEQKNEHFKIMKKIKNDGECKV